MEQGQLQRRTPALNTKHKRAQCQVLERCRHAADHGAWPWSPPPTASQQLPLLTLCTSSITYLPEGLRSAMKGTRSDTRWKSSRVRSRPQARAMAIRCSTACSGQAVTVGMRRRMVSSPWQPSKQSGCPQAHEHGAPTQPTGVGGAAGGHHNDHGVLKGCPRHDVPRLDVLLQQLQNIPASVTISRRGRSPHSAEHCTRRC